MQNLIVISSLQQGAVTGKPVVTCEKSKFSVKLTVRPEIQAGG